MLYDDEFVLALPDTPMDAFMPIIQRLSEAISPYLGKRLTVEDREYIIEARDLITAIADEHHLLQDPLLHRISVSDNPKELKELFDELNGVCARRQERLEREAHRARFATLVTRGFHYSLSEADTNRIQTLINELRNGIVSIKKFEEDHKKRILQRLETVQRELHRRLSNLDRF
jgi:hypothetical protein